ncbi:MAG: glycosyltransferase family 39 protein, partial [Chloroflexota bacterium]
MSRTNRAGLGILSSHGFVLMLVAILCLAAWLRFYRLGAQSLWNDEGNSARIAERSVSLIIEGAAGDVHPPGYYLLLSAWRGLLGESEWALRSLSAVAGVALVALTGLLGRYLFDRTSGLVAASFCAFSPLAVYYAQEVRMYALLAAFTAASLYTTFLALAAIEQAETKERVRSPVGPLMIYVLVNALGLYTHYTFAFVFLAHNAFFFLRWLAGVQRGSVNWKGLSYWVAPQAAVGLLYLPWLPTALRAAGWSSSGGGYATGSALLDLIRVLSVGTTLPLGDAAVAIVGSGALLLLSFCSPGKLGPRAVEGREENWAVLGLGVYLVVPLSLLLGLDLYKPAWLKFLVIALPPFHLLMARGTCFLGFTASQLLRLREPWGLRLRTLTYVLVLALAGLIVRPSLCNLYFDPAYARDDYRQLAADIRAMSRPGDAVVLNAPNQWEVFTYYHPDKDVHPAPYRPGPGAGEAFLQPLADQYERLFVLYWGDAESDPSRRIESWLAGNAYKASDRWYGNVRLATYGLAPLAVVPDQDVNVSFAGNIRLKGFSLVDDTFSPGQIIPVTLFWEAVEPVEHSYKVTVQMLDREGELVSQIDTVPGDGLKPTTSWQPGQTVDDRYGVRVPQGTARDRHSLLVAVYRQSDGERLAVERSGRV